MADKIEQLQRRGVIIPSPEQVWLDDSVDPDRIESGVVLNPGTRISGADTSIGPDCILGGESPVTVASCQLGQGVQLKGGYHDGAVFLDHAEVGSAAHIRPGTILEEQSSCAHGVGLKQTVFFPFMVAGSLINFCDALMTGGTHRKNHSEIGSGYVHFNFTPRGDKATPSLIGDVARGVLLNQNPIFLGGQGGLIGPVKIAYGTTLAAGVMQRSDVLEENLLILGGDEFPSGSRSFDSRIYGRIQRTLLRNLEYLGNIQALRAWYQTVRSRYSHHHWQKAVHLGGIDNLERIYNERLKRLSDLTERLAVSASLVEKDTIRKQQEVWVKRWPSVYDKLKGMKNADGESSLKDQVKGIFSDPPGSYLETLQQLSVDDQDRIQSWLQSIVDSFTAFQLTGDDT